MNAKQVSGIKARKLYQVRVHEAGRFGRQVGHKARLLPRAAAARIAKRLRATRRFELVTIDPVIVNTTPEQRAYLDARY